MSTSTAIGIEDLKNQLVEKVREDKVSSNQTVVTNSRHYQALTATNAALNKVLEAIDNQTTGDFLAMDIREALNHLGEITGEVTTDDLLYNIFSKFCIGK